MPGQLLQNRNTAVQAPVMPVHTQDSPRELTIPARYIPQRRKKRAAVRSPGLRHLHRTTPPRSGLVQKIPILPRPAPVAAVTPVLRDLTVPRPPDHPAAALPGPAEVAAAVAAAAAAAHVAQEVEVAVHAAEGNNAKILRHEKDNDHFGSHPDSRSYSTISNIS